MNKKTTNAAIAEAKRFLERAIAALEASDKDKAYWACGGLEAAAAKRASMDLTRALAKMRGPDHE